MQGLIILVIFVGIVIFIQYLQKNKKVLSAEELEEENKKQEEKEKQNEQLMKQIQDRKIIAEYGPKRIGVICPHCQSRGSVRTKPIKRKKGISGTKATGAILTGGISLLATGLSRKETETQAHCDKCDSTWFF